MWRNGIMPSAKDSFYHSTLAAGINHTPVLVTLDTPLLKDTYMSFEAGQTTTNYGTSTVFKVSVPGDGSDKRALLKFDISAIPAGVALESASLVLDCSSFSGAATTLQLYLILRSDWVESEATNIIYKTGNDWTAPGAQGAGNDYQTSPKIASDYSISGTGQKIIPFTLSEFNKFVNGTYTSPDMLIRAAGAIMDFSSLNHGTSNLRPFTRVTYYI